MKILYYSSHPHLNLASPSGYGTHMREMISAFTELGHEVKPVIMGGTTLTYTNLAIKGRSPLKKLVAACVPAYAWESAKDYKLDNFDKYAYKVLEEEVQRFNPDVIYERASYLQTSGIRAAIKHHIKHILEVNAPYAEERVQLQGNSFFASKGVGVEKTLLEKSSKIAVVSSALRNHLSTTYKIKQEKFILTPNAINPASINYNPEEADQQRQKLNLAGKTVIGFVGSIFPWHGVDILISAFKAVLDVTEKPVHLLIVGDGEILPILKAQADRDGLGNLITFTGNVRHQDVFNLIACMDICVMAKSNWYGSPVKIFEYAAMGKAVIAPDNIPVRDVMQNGITGLLVQPSIESLTQALVSYLQNDALRESCATAFRDLTLNKYTWKHNAALVLSAAV